MSKKIIILNGSPRKNGNTSALVREFTKSAEEGDGNLLRGNNRASVLLMVAERNGFEDALLYYDHLLEHLRWKNLGHILAGGNGYVGDIEGKQELQKAKAAKMVIYCYTEALSDIA